MSAQRGMDRMVCALPRVDRAARLDRRPLEVEREAAVADPLRSPLPDTTRAASLHAKLARPRALPVGDVQAIGLRHRPRHRDRQVIGGCAHRTSSVPIRMLDTGVTIGPEITMATRAPPTGFDD